MVIMIIFLVLSVVCVIGIAIYLNDKKKNINTNIKQSTNEETKEKGDKKSKKKLANLLQIKIKGNIVNLGNRYSNIIRLGNIDFNMLSNSEQDSVESILIQTALAIDYPVQFFSTTEYIDTSKAVSLIKKNKSNNVNIQEYKEYLIEYLENLKENKSISVRKNYAIISYDGLYENAIEELNRKSASFKGNLLRTKIVCEVLNKNEIKDLIHRELNKNSAPNISILEEGGKNLYVGKKQKTRSKKY